MTDPKTSTSTKPDQDYTEKQPGWFRNSWSQLGHGANNVFWSCTHPRQATLRLLGSGVTLTGIVLLLQGFAYLLGGEPYSAQLNGLDPSAATKVLVDRMRPVGNATKDVIIELREEMETGAEPEYRR